MSQHAREGLSSGAAANNRVAFVAAWRRYHGRLRALCLRWVGGHAGDAEDVLGRVALRAVEDIASREDRIASYPAWLTRIAWNVAMDLHRERAYRAQLIDDYADVARDMGAQEAPSAESEHIHAELRASVRAAIDRLPSRLQSVSRRRLLDGAGYDEIAAEVGITEENVRKRIQEARALLARRLGPGHLH